MNESRAASADELEGAYVARLPALKISAEALRRITEQALNGFDHRHVDRIAFRAKGAASFVAKALGDDVAHSYVRPLEEIEDQLAGRVIVFFTHDVPLVRDILLGTFTRVEQGYRRPERDDSFGYESHHMVCVIPEHLKDDAWRAQPAMPNTFELQIRTLFMHAYAEPQHDFGYKGPDDLTSAQQRELAWIAASAWGGDQALERLLSSDLRVDLSDSSGSDTSGGARDEGTH